ncbi:MAG: hypothetical protein V1846_05270, partial [Candidatus Komeilibacteria bacterium]
LPGIRNKVCSNNCTALGNGACVPYGASVLSLAGADVMYVNGSPYFYPACTTPFADLQSVQYSGNACSATPNVNIPAQNNTSAITAGQMFRTSNLGPGPNIVAIKFQTTKGPTCGGAISTVASPTDNIIYYLSNWQFGRTSASRWVCTSNSSGNANNDIHGKAWYEYDFIDSSWSLPNWSVFGGTCGFPLNACYYVQNINTVACNTVTAVDGALQNSWLWLSSLPDRTIYCRLKYFAT